MGLLAATGQTTADFENTLFLGELSMKGEIRRVQGVLPMTILAREKGIGRIFVPKDNAKEASAVQGIEVYGVEMCFR